MSRERRIILLLLAIIAVLISAAVLHIPLYSDEVAYHLILGNYFGNHGEIATLFPQCVPSDGSTAIPGVFAPFQAIGTLFYSALPSPNLLRWIGLGLFLANAFLFFHASSRSLRSRSTGLALTLAYFTLGVAPLNWSIHRPDGWILLVVQALCTFILSGSDRKSPEWKIRKQGIALASIVLAACFSCSLHPNALYLTPLFLLAIHAIPSTGWAKGAAAILIAYAEYRCLAQASALTSCPNDPSLATYLAMESLNPKYFFDHTSRFLEIFALNIAELWRYPDSILYHDFYLPRWLVWTGPATVQRLLNILAVLIWIFAALLAWKIGRPAPLIRKNEPSGRNARAVFLCLLLMLTGFAGFQSKKNFYTSALVVPIGLYMLLALKLWLAPAGNSSLGRRLLPVFIAAAMVNAIYLSTFAIVAETTEDRRRTFENFDDFSFVVHDQAKLDRELEELRKSCGMPDRERLNRLVVDDVTYWSFRRTTHPMHSFYVAKGTYSFAILSLDRFLRHSESSGAIVRCHELDRHPDLLKSAVQAGEFCCVSLESGESQYGPRK